MALETLIPIIITVLVVVFVWTIFKKLFKILFFIGIVLFLIIAGTTYYIYQDIVDLRQNLDGSTKKIMLVDNNKVITGFLLNGEVNLLSDGKLEEYSSHLKEKNYEKILENSYKLMIFNLNIVSDLNTDEIELEDKTISKQDALSDLKSEKGMQEKADLFGAILTEEVFSPKNPLFLFSEYKKGNIIVYPETAFFKAVKIMPLGFIRDKAEDMFGKAKEKAKTLIEAVE